LYRKKKRKTYKTLTDMRKIVYTLITALAIPTCMMAQDDDLYYVPSSKTEKSVSTVRKEAVKATTPTTTVNHVYYTPQSTVAVDRATRDVDEYNRRYTTTTTDDTTYTYNDTEEQGEWLNGGFNGSEDDYECAQRIIRFRNPRFAISIGSPLYFDIVYGLNSWDWNVYTDGLYAYAFPTFSNPLWWDWRWNSYGWGWGWNYGWPSYGLGWGGRGWHFGLGWDGFGFGWGGFGWDFAWHNHGWHGAGWGGPGFAGGGFGGWRGVTAYHNDRRQSAGAGMGLTRGEGSRLSGSRVSGNRMEGNRGMVGSGMTRGSRVGSGANTRAGSGERSMTTGEIRRVVGTRSSANGSGFGQSDSRRGSASYTRPSSTRVSESSSMGRSSSVRGGNSGAVTRSEGSGSRQSAPSYNRGSSSSSRSSMESRSSSSRSSSTSRSSGSGYSSGSSRSSFSGGGSSSHSGGFSGGGSHSGGGSRGGGGGRR
jgi:hypothetical protein